jgi:hypothetical protein
MTVLSTRRCQCERRYSERARVASSKPCGMPLVLLHDALVCACCDLGCYPNRET